MAESHLKHWWGEDTEYYPRYGLHIAYLAYDVTTQLTPVDRAKPNMEPIQGLIINILELIKLIVIIYVIISVLISFNIINRYNPIIQKITYGLGRIVDPMLAPFRKLLQKLFGAMGGFDLSPILLLIGIQFLQSGVYHWL